MKYSIRKEKNKQKEFEKNKGKEKQKRKVRKRRIEPQELNNGSCSEDKRTKEDNSNWRNEKEREEKLRGNLM